MTPIEKIEETIALAMETGGAADILSALCAMPIDLRCALADELVPWQPIEDAPKDGTPILVRWADKQTKWDAAIAHYENGKFGYLTTNAGFRAFMDQPTEFRDGVARKPLPAAPKREG